MEPEERRSSLTHTRKTRFQAKVNQSEKEVTAWAADVDQQWNT